MKTEQFHVHVEMEEEHWWFLARRAIMLELVRRLLTPSKESVVVDVGCGTGGNIVSLLPYYACVGIDPSEEAIRLAQEQIPGVQFHCAPIPGGLGELLGQARLLLLMDVLEHTPDDFDFFSKLLAFVRPGTHILITVPALKSLWSEHDVSFGHFRRYEREGLVEVWSDLPVETRLVSYFNSRLYPIIRAIRAFNRWSGRTSGIGGTDFRMPLRPLNHLLTRILAGEARILVGLLEGRRREGFSRGASLVAVLRRREGPVVPRRRPGGGSP